MKRAQNTKRFTPWASCGSCTKSARLKWLFQIMKNSTEPRHCLTEFTKPSRSSADDKHENEAGQVPENRRRSSRGGWCRGMGIGHGVVVLRRCEYCDSELELKFSRGRWETLLEIKKRRHCGRVCANHSVKLRNSATVDPQKSERVPGAYWTRVAWK